MNVYYTDFGSYFIVFSSALLQFFFFFFGHFASIIAVLFHYWLFPVLNAGTRTFGIDQTCSSHLKY